MLSHLDLLCFCSASYAGNVDSFRKELRISGIVNIDSYYGDSLHKYTVELSDCYVIVFRGSENKFDWVNDFTINAVDYDHTNVHQGFMSALDAEINPRLQFDKPVYVTGHSFGGALAVLHAFKLIEAKNNSEINEVIVFGAPMLGAESFKEKYDSILGATTILYRNGSDIIPSLPPVGYVKVGNIISIGKKRSCWNPLKYYYMFKDHSIYEYLKSMGFNNA